MSFSIRTETLRYIVNVDTLGAQRTVRILKTFHRLLTAAIVWISDRAGLTVTLEVSARVLAECTRRARRVRAVIYQFATARGFSRVSGLAGTNLYHETHALP